MAAGGHSRVLGWGAEALAQCGRLDREFRFAMRGAPQAEGEAGVAAGTKARAGNMVQPEAPGKGSTWR